jgi:hypothetical protein
MKATVVQFTARKQVFTLENIRRLRIAEHNLRQLTEEIHLLRHIGRGRPKNWMRCWHPICFETRLALGEKISKAELKQHIDLIEKYRLSFGLQTK